MRRPALVATAVAIPALGLGACGGSSERDRITAVIKAFNNQPTTLCTKYGTANLIRQNFATKSFCIARASTKGAKDPFVKIVSIKIKGTTATAVTAAGVNPGKGTKEALGFVKQGGAWKIDEIIPA